MTKLSYQNYGSSILLYITADTDEEAMGKYLSLYNWNATSSEPSIVTTGVICVWSTQQRLYNYLFNTFVHKLLNDKGSLHYKGKPGGVNDEALELTNEAFDAIEYDQYKSVNSNYEFSTLGSISAEKPDSDFKDSILNYAFSSK